MRWLVLGLIVVLVARAASAQLAPESPDSASALAARIDSLQQQRVGLQAALREVEAQLQEAGAALRRLEFRQHGASEVVLLTNMEASMRVQPSPGARVVQLLPEGTPLAGIDFDGAYWKVRHDGLEGWVMRVFVDEGADAEAFKRMVAENGRLTADGQGDRWDWRSEREGKTLLVTDLGVHPPNSAGGISVFYAVAHLDSASTLRDIALRVTPYDAAGKRQTGRNSGVSTRQLRRFGPLSVGDGVRQFDFENVWYNEDIVCVVVERIDVTYTDGRRASFVRNVADALSRRIDNDCAVEAASIE